LMNVLVQMNNLFCKVMLIQFKFGHFLALNRAVLAI
jgi:hypothetical protein